MIILDYLKVIGNIALIMIGAYVVWAAIASFVAWDLSCFDVKTWGWFEVRVLIVVFITGAIGSLSCSN